MSSEARRLITPEEMAGNAGKSVVISDDERGFDVSDGEDGGGAGLPAGGTTGQVLAKTSNVDQEVGWANQATGWNLTGNTVNPATDFIGPINPVALNIRIGGYPAGVVGGHSSGSNTALGYNGMSYVSPPTGSGLTGIGTYSLAGATSGSANTALGFQGLQLCNSGYDNTAAGWGSQRFLTTGYRNTSIGKIALNKNTNGFENTALGHQSLYENLTGDNNTAAGNLALGTLVSGNNNTAVGNAALGGNIAGNNNVGLGNAAGYGETGSNKLYIANINTKALIHGDFNTNQVQINAAGTPVLTACAALEIISTNRGLLLPRLTKAQRNAIATPVAGLMIYQTDNTPGLRTFNGTNWMAYTETAD